MKKFLKELGISLIIFSILTLVIVSISDPIDTDPKTTGSQLQIKHSLKV